MFTNHPERARAFALKAETRAALVQAEPSYDAVLEKDIPLTGQLAVSEADDFAHHTSIKHYSLHSFNGDRGISFAAVPPQLAKLAGKNVTITGLSLPEVVAAETVTESPHTAAPEMAAVTPALQSNAAVTPAATQTITSIGSGVPAGSATALDSTFGNQTTAVLILKFAGNAAVYTPGSGIQAPYLQTFQGPATPNVNEFLKEVSYNQAFMSTDVYTTLVVPGSYDCNSTDAMATAAITAAIPAGLDVSKYNHFVYVYPAASCWFGGLGTAGALNPTALIPHQYTNIFFPVTPTDNYLNPATLDFLWFANAQHEFGHGLGMGHSNSLDFGALSLGPLDYTAAHPGTVSPGDAVNPTAPTDPTAGVITAIATEYADDFSDMGNYQGRYNGQLAAQILGWIPPSGNQDITTSGSFTIAPTEVNTGLRTLHILRDPVSSSWIWVEYHQPIGIYTPRALSANPLNVTPGVSLYSGAQFHYQDGFLNNGSTYLMDMTPVSQPNMFDDGTLAPGKSWSDPYSLLTITTGTQTAISLGVKVSYDTPCATVALDSSTTPAAGGTGSVTITAPNTCTWSVSSNAPWITFPGTKTGTGNATVQFVSKANTNSSQRNSYITAQRQSLPIVQLGTGVSILPRTPMTVAAGTFVPVVFNITDTAGINDFSALYLNIRTNVSYTPNVGCIVSVGSGSNDSSNEPAYAFLSLNTNGSFGGAIATGDPGTLTGPNCSIDVHASTWVVKGKSATLTMMMSFPSGFVGIHSIDGFGIGAVQNDSVPLSYINVTAANPNTPNILISPASSVAPLTGSADSTVPFTINGTNTNFTAGTTMTVGGKGVNVKNLQVVNATTITGSFVVKDTATKGSQPVTITSGSEVANTTFTVAPATSIALSPYSGAKGSKVAVAIMGTDTNFTTASTLTSSGTRFAVNKVTFVSATELTAEFVLDADTESNPRTITVTSGAEVDTATFTVKPAVIPQIVISPPTGNQGDFAVVSIHGTDTHFTDATKITIPGTDITISEVNVQDSQTIIAKFTMTSTATAVAREVMVTTGSEVVRGSFTVTAMADTTTSIAASAASIEETASAMLTVTVAPKTGTGVPAGYVSIRDTKEGLEDIVGTMQLTGGKATIPVSNLTVGDHSFSAQYLGDNAAFAQSKSSADAKVTVTADPGKATLATTATLQMLANGSYEAIVTIANSGKGTAQKVAMTTATLGGTASSQDASGALPDIAPSGSTSALFDFPASAGTPGTASVLKFSGTYKGGNFSGSARITLPSAPATN